MDKLPTVKMKPLHINGTAVVLAHAHLHDATDLLRVIQAAYAEFLGKLDPPSGAFAETEQSIAAKLGKGGAIKALAGNTIIGCVLYESKGDFMYFGRLAVLPAWRRAGVAQGLIAAVEERAKAVGLQRVQIGVRLVLPAHQAYYEGLGYRPIAYACHPGFSQPTSVTMEKQL
ncbi:MAG: GNAT family N-acetyltransferase [Caldilineaceae bacterium]